MPRTKLQTQFAPKPNLLAETLKAYKAEKGIKDSEIAKKLGWKNRQTANVKLNQPANNWRIGELNAVCDVIGCPIGVAIDSFRQSV